MREGGGGSSGFVFEGLLGGSAGVLIVDEAGSRVATDGLDLVDCNDIRLLSASLYVGKALDFSISL